ncbi:hypothetical protein PSY47_23725, partial [Shigella flexneri]|nr:hypothetical protein [Shigella flexneri]
DSLIVIGAHNFVCAYQILMTVLSSVVYQNFCLHSQVNELQDYISKLELRLQAYSSLESMELITSSGLEDDDLPNRRLKRLAL